MNKKILILLLIVLCIVAGGLYYFFGKKGPVNPRENNIQNTVNTKKDKTVNNNIKDSDKKIKNYAIGEYGDYENYIVKDLSIEDQKNLQMILNERENVKVKYLALIDEAKKTPDADKTDSVRKSLNEYKKNLDKFDKRIRPYMIKDKIEQYNNTVKNLEIEKAEERAYSK